MATINELISLIRTAIYGKDIRSSIADAMENISGRQDVADNNEITRQTNESQRQTAETTRIQTDIQRTTDVNAIKDAYDAATKANTNVELTNARHDNVNNVDFNTVGERLDDHSSQLAEKANQSTVLALQTSVNNIGNASPKGVYTTVPLLTAAKPTGDTGIYLVTGNVAEVASLAVTAAPTSIGNVTVTLNGVATNIAVTSGVAEVASLNVSAIPTVAGNVTVTLNGTAFNIAVDPATDTTTDLVATKIRNATYTGWATGGTGSVITFTASAVGVKTDATYSAGTTGATGTMSTTTQGVDADTTTTVSTKIRNAAYTGWTTGGTGTTITFTCNTTGAKTDSVYSAGSTGAAGTMTTTTQGVDADYGWYYWNSSLWTRGGTYQSTGVGENEITLNKVSLPFVVAAKNYCYDFTQSKIILNTNTQYSTNEFGNKTITFVSDAYTNGINILSGSYILYIRFKLSDISSLGSAFTARVGFFDGWSNRTYGNVNTTITSDKQGQYIDIWATINYTQAGVNLKCQPILIFENTPLNVNFTIQINKIAIFQSTSGITKDITDNYFDLLYYPIFNLPNSYLKTFLGITALEDIVNSNLVDYSVFDLAYIKDNKLIMNHDHINGNNAIAKYTVADLGENSVSVKCSAKFNGGGNSTVALISQPNGMYGNGVTVVTNGCIHCTFTSSGTANIGYFENGILTNISTLTFPELDTSGNTEYWFGYTVTPTGLNVTLPNGSVQFVTSTKFAEHNGRYVVFEHFLVDATQGNFYPGFARFYAIGATALLDDYFLRQNGAIGISPQGHVYTQFRNVV